MQKHEVPLPPQAEMPSHNGVNTPEVALPEHIRGYTPKGQEAVLEEEARFAEDMIADWHVEQAADQMMNALEYGQHAERLGRRERQIGKIAMVKQIVGRRLIGGLRYNQPKHDDFASAAHAKREEEAHNLERNSVLSKVRDDLAEFEAMNRDEVIDGEDVPNMARQKLNDYLERELPANFQEDYNQFVSIIEEHKIERLADHVEWLTKASDAVLLNFLQWHNHRIDTLNADPSFQETVVGMKQEVKDSIKASVMAGNLPREALLSFKRIDNVRVIAGDVFDTSMQSLLGYYRHDVGHIVVGEDFDMDTFQHEIYHSALGHMENRIMDEAMTEHLTLAAHGGDYQTLNPDKRRDEGTYVRFRRANDRILRSGIRPVPIDSQIGAYIEGDGDGPMASKFRKQLSEAYGGVDVMKFVDTEMLRAFWSAQECSPGLSHHELMDYAASEVSRSIIILGQYAKGASFDQMRANAARDKRRDNSAWLASVDRVELYLGEDHSRSRPRARRQAHSHAH